MEVIITDTLSFNEHVNTVLTRVSQVGYALRYTLQGTQSTVSEVRLSGM